MQKPFSSPQVKKPSLLTTSPGESPTSAKRSNNSRGFAPSPSINNLRQPHSASKAYYVNDHSPSNKDELETEIMSQLKALKEMKNEMGVQKTIISSYIENLQNQHNVNIDIQANNANALYQGLWATPSQRSSQKNLRSHQSVASADRTPEAVNNKLEENLFAEKKPVGSFQNQVNKVESTYQKILSTIRQEKGASPQLKKINTNIQVKDNKALLDNQKSAERMKSNDKMKYMGRGASSQSSSINEIKDPKKKILSPNKSIENEYKPSINRIENISNIESAIRKQRERKPIEIILGTDLKAAEARRSSRDNHPSSGEIKKTYKIGAVSPSNNLFKTNNRPESSVSAINSYRRLNQHQQRENDQNPSYAGYNEVNGVQVNRRVPAEVQKKSRAPNPPEGQNEFNEVEGETLNLQNQQEYTYINSPLDQKNQKRFNERVDQDSANALKEAALERHQKMINDLSEQINKLNEEVLSRDEYIKKFKIEEEEQLFRFHEELSNKELEIQNYVQKLAEAQAIRKNSASKPIDTEEINRELELIINQYKTENKELKRLLHVKDEGSGVVQANADILRNLGNNKNDQVKFPEDDSEIIRGRTEDDPQQDIDIETNIEQHEQEVVSLYHELQGRYNDLQSQIESLKHGETQNRKLSQDLHKRSKVEHDEGRIQLLESKIKELNERYLSLQAKLNKFTQLQNTISQFRGQEVGDDINSEVESLIEQYETSQKEILQLKEEHNSIRLAHQNKDQREADRSREFEEKNIILNNELTELKKNIEHNHQQNALALAAGESRLTNIEEENKRLNKEICRVLEEVEAESMTRDEAHSSVNPELNLIRDRFHSLKSHLQDLENNKTTNEKMNYELMDENLKLTDDLSRVHSENENLKNALDSRNKDSGEAEQTFKSKIKELEEVKANIEAQNENLIQTVHELEQEATENLRKLISSEETLKVKVNLDLKVAELEKENLNLSQIIKERDANLNTAERNIETIRNNSIQVKEQDDRSKVRQEQLEERNKWLEEQLSQLNINSEKQLIEVQNNSIELLESIKGENKTLINQIDELKREISNEGIKEQVHSRQSSDYSELMDQIKTIRSERDEYRAKLDDLNDEFKLKDKQLESLKYDNNQLKDFILQNHENSLYGSNINEPEEQKEFKASYTNVEPQSIKSIQEANDNTSKAPKLSSENRQGTQIIKSRTMRDSTEGAFKRSSTTLPIKSEESTNAGRTKNRKDIEFDPVYKSLENIIRELQEKLSNNEKNIKKQIEVRVMEENEKFNRHEETLLAEIQILKQERDGLAKKIDDLEWQKAYEHTEKLRSEKGSGGDNTEQASNQPKPFINAESKKKRKRKNKNKVEEDV